MPQQRMGAPDGWEVVEDSAAPAPPAVPDGWDVIDAPEKPDNAMGGLSAATAAGAAATATGAAVVGTQPARGLLERVATAPAFGQSAAKLASRVAAPLNVVKQGYDVLSGRQSVFDAGKDALLNEGARRFFRPERVVRAGAKLMQRAALPVAEKLAATGAGLAGGGVAAGAAGGLAGVAGTAGFLGALQHDANRDVTIDYSKNTPDTAIARVFSNMRDSEANRGKTLAERQDDPNDVMFSPDEETTVSAAPAGGSRVSAVVQAFFGRR